MTGRLIACALLLAAAALTAWLIYPASLPAAVISGFAVAILALAALFRSGSANGRGKAAAAGGKDALPGHAVALRQSRAMARAEDGEIRGIPSGPY